MTITLIIWIIFGALAGWIAGLAFESDDSSSMPSNIMIGALGAVAGGIFYALINNGALDSFSVTGLIISITGSVLLLAVIKGFTKAQ
jgi:uncharacterized membrane protein YeaQ/YmgE (transglycosylase-associated protein family)